ncbi:MAG: tRNA (adenosine(37)-N6)-threonylcarbamoyltransferase complex ATPase subunit type 1 TsaE [Candidatus Paceibacterota bacterium]
MEKVITINSEETEKLGFLTAKKVLDLAYNEKALVLALDGELGAGKTTFLKGFAKGLGLNKKIQSPTFIIMNRFSLSSKKYTDFYHFDCYRIENGKEMDCLDLNDVLDKKTNIVCIEWASKIKNLLPKKTINIDFKVGNGNERVIKIKNLCRIKKITS